jgi:tRNA dimethylallyltransferase
MKRHTRNYARRQLTWMRKLAGVAMVDTTGRSAEQVADEVMLLVDHRLSDSPA